MRLVLMTYRGCVRKEAIAPANPVERMRRVDVSSTAIVLGILNYRPMVFIRLISTILSDNQRKRIRNKINKC